MTDLEAYVEAPGRDELVKRGARQDRRARHHLHLLPVHLGDRARRRQGHPGRPLGAHRRARLPAGLRCRPPTCSSTATAITSATAPRPRSWSASPTPRPSCSCRGTSGSARVFCTCFRNREEDEDPGAFLTSDCRGNLRRIHEQFQKKHKALHLRHGYRARDDVAQEGRGRTAGRRLHASPTATTSTSSRACARCSLQVIDYARAHGPRHDPGRPRGLARPARAQLHLRRRAAHLRPPDHLPPDLRPGGARARPDRLLHVQAVHGRLGVGLPPQHLALVGRRGRGQSARPGSAAGAGGLLHLLARRREHVHAGRRGAPEEAGSDRAATASAA